MKSFFRFLWVLFGLTWCEQPLMATDAVPMKVRHGLPIVSLCINGHGPYELLLDTGTQSTMVDEKLARDLHLTIVDRTQLITPNGMHPLGRAIAETVTVGPEKLASVEFLVDDLPELHSLSPQLRGVLGQNILTHFNFRLDYRHGQVEFEPETRETAGAELPFDFQEGRIILSAEIAGSQKLSLLLDSGATDLMLFHSAPATGARSGSMASLTTNNGTSQVHQANLSQVKIGNAVLRDVRAGLSSTSTLTGIDGLMPTNLFESIYFDFGRRSIFVAGRNIMMGRAEQTR